MIKFIKIVIITIVFGVITILCLNAIVSSSTKNLNYDSISLVPTKKVALVLGTSKYLSNGNENLFYSYRINAVTELYKNKKVSFILISGDNGTQYYNEPETIKKDLIANGIPSEVIFLDYAGFRTLDSIVRCKKVFGEDDIIVVSQQFHNERAIYLAKANDMKAVGYNAKDIKKKIWL